MEFITLANLISAFNNKNKATNKNKTYCHITGIMYYSKPDSNNAICALYFKENTFNREFTSKLEFKSENDLINYLNYHS